MIKQTGAISLLDIQNEFGGDNPAELSEYYAGGVLVDSAAVRNATTQQADRDGIAYNSPIPSSGNITLAHFYGASAKIEMLDRYPSDLSYTRTTDGTQETTLELFMNGGVPYWQSKNNGVVANSNSFRSGKGSEMEFRITVVSGTEPTLQNVVLGQWETFNSIQKILTLTTGNDSSKNCQLKIETRYKTRLDHVQEKTITFEAINSFIPTEGWNTLPMSRTFVKTESGIAELRYRFYVSGNQQRFQILRDGVLWQDHLIAEMEKGMDIMWSITDGTFDVHTGMTSDGTLWKDFPTDWQFAVQTGNNSSKSATMHIEMRQSDLHSNVRVVDVVVSVQNTFIDPIAWGTLPENASEYDLTVETATPTSNEFKTRVNGSAIEWTVFDNNVQLPWVSLGDFAGNLQYRVILTDGNGNGEQLDWVDVGSSTVGDVLFSTLETGAESFNTGTFRVEFRQKNKTEVVTQPIEFTMWCRNNYITPLAIIQANMPESISREITELEPSIQKIEYRIWKDGDGAVWHATWWNGANVSGDEAIIDNVLHHGAQININDVIGNATYVNIIKGEWVDIGSDVIKVSSELSSSTDFDTIKETGIQVTIRQKDNVDVSATTNPIMKITNKIPKANISSWVTNDNCSSSISGNRVPRAPVDNALPWLYHQTLYAGEHTQKLSLSDLENRAVCGLDIYSRGVEKFIRIARLNPPSNSSALFSGDVNQTDRAVSETLLGVGNIQFRFVKVSGEDPILKNIVLGSWTDIIEEQTSEDVWTVFGNNHFIGYRSEVDKSGTFRLELRDKDRLNVVVSKDILISANFTGSFPWGVENKTFGGNHISSSSEPKFNLSQYSVNDPRINILPGGGTLDTRSIGTRPCDQLMFVIKSVNAITGTFTTLVDKNGTVLEVGRIYPVRHLNGAITPDELSLEQIKFDPSAPDGSIVHVDVEILPSSDVTLVNEDSRYRFHLYLEKRGGEYESYTIETVPNYTIVKPSSGVVQGRLRLYADGTALKYQIIMDGAIQQSGTLSAVGTNTRVRVNESSKSSQPWAQQTNTGDEDSSFNRWDYVVNGYDNTFGIDVPETTSGFFEVQIEHVPSVNATGGKTYTTRIDVQSTYIPEMVLNNMGDTVVTTRGAPDQTGPITGTLKVEARVDGYYIHDYKVADTTTGAGLELNITLDTGSPTAVNSPGYGEWFTWENGMSNVEGFGTSVLFNTVAQEKSTNRSDYTIQVRQKGRETNFISFTFRHNVVSEYVPAGTFTTTEIPDLLKSLTTPILHGRMRVVWDTTYSAYYFEYTSETGVRWSRYALIGGGISMGDLQYRAKLISGDRESIADTTDWTDITDSAYVGDVIPANPETTTSAGWEFEFRQKSRTDVTYNDTVVLSLKNTTVNPRPWAQTVDQTFTFAKTKTDSGQTFIKLTVEYPNWNTCTLVITMTEGVGTFIHKVPMIIEGDWDSTHRPEMIVQVVASTADSTWTGITNNNWTTVTPTQSVKFIGPEGVSKNVQFIVRMRQKSLTSNFSPKVSYNLTIGSTAIPSVVFTPDPINTDYASQNYTKQSVAFQISGGVISWKWWVTLGGGTSYHRGGATWDGNIGNEVLEFKFIPTNLQGTNYISDWTTFQTDIWKTFWIISSGSGSRYSIGTLHIRQKNKPTNAWEVPVYCKNRKY